VAIIDQWRGRGHHHRARTLHRNPQAPKWTQKRDDDIALIGVAQLGKHPGLRRAVELVRGVPVQIYALIPRARAMIIHSRRRRRRASQCRPWPQCRPRRPA
jgi:hypothetical protein